MKQAPAGKARLEQSEVSFPLKNICLGLPETHSPPNCFFPRPSGLVCLRFPRFYHGGRVVSSPGGSSRPFSS